MIGMFYKILTNMILMEVEQDELLELSLTKCI